jgi:hypothetical protein
LPSKLKTLWLPVCWKTVRFANNPPIRDEATKDGAPDLWQVDLSCLLH